MNLRRVGAYALLAGLLSLVALLDFLVLWLISSGVGLRLISQADWQTFVPDALVALLTGVVVGIVLLLVQGRNRRRDAQAQTQREWGIVRARVRGVIQYRETIADPRDLRRMGSAVEELLAIGHAYPLRDWQRTVVDPALSVGITVK